jgi:hypothetical protein
MYSRIEMLAVIESIDDILGLLMKLFNEVYVLSSCSCTILVKVRIDSRERCG